MPNRPRRVANQLTAAVWVGVFCAVALLPPRANAGGFFLQEQSVSASGRAFAGDAAAAEDASTIFYNPAGLTQLRGGMQAEAGLYLIAPESNLTDRGSTAAVGVSPPTAVGGLSSDQGFNPQATGDVYLAAPLRPDLWIGLGITTPFGLQDNYQLNYFGRYDSTKTKLQTLDIAPTAAYAVNSWLSVGGGVDFQYANGALQNALPDPFAPGGPSPSTDGLFNATGNDWAVGFNAGVLAKPTDALRVGFSYRSGTEHSLKGNATSEIPGVVSSSQSATANFKLPDVASLGIAYNVTPMVTLLAQADYYGWSRFNQIRIAFADGTQQVVPENFKDTVGFSVGTEWKVSDRWTLRGGVEFDPTPTPNGARSTALPDSDRTWLALGASYEFTKRFGLDVSYAHDFSGTVPINRNDSFPTLATNVTTTATTTSSTSNVVGLAMRVRY
jgi:long-chain fatty acid transport protein